MKTVRTHTIATDELRKYWDYFYKVPESACLVVEVVDLRQKQTSWSTDNTVQFNENCHSFWKVHIFNQKTVFVFRSTIKQRTNCIIELWRFIPDGWGIVFYVTDAVVHWYGKVFSYRTRGENKSLTTFIAAIQLSVSDGSSFKTIERFLFSFFITKIYTWGILLLCAFVSLSLKKKKHSVAG